jgi:tetratricopeptide (TPR) repeat protein
MRGLTEEAIISWGNAIEMKDEHQYSILNLMIAKWRSGAITDSDLIKSLEEAESLNDKEDTFLIKGLMLLGIGEKEEALKIFKKVFSDELAQNQSQED